jgi:hypothetical protein
MAQAKLRVSPRQALAFAFERQGFIRNQLKPLQVVERLVAVQSQYMASVPQAVWTRQPDVAADWADRAQYASKSLVRVWCLRGTVHTLRSTDLALFAGLRLERKDYWFQRYLEAHGVSATELARRNRRIMDALADGSLNRKELHERVPALKDLREVGYGIDVRPLAFMGEVVFAGVDGNHPRFARRDQWLPRLKWEPPSAAAAGCELLKRYLGAYGPATRQDFAYWSGLKGLQLKQIMADSAAELAQVEVEGWPGIQLLLKRDLAALRRQEPVLPAVRMLPKFDALLLAWRDKRKLVDPAGHRGIYRKAAQVEAAVLIDGRISAAWRAQSGKTLTFQLNPLRKLSKREMKLIQDEADRFAQWQGAGGARVVEIASFD